jgi:hypothetical protein
MESLNAVPAADSRKPKPVYTIVRRNGYQKGFWIRIGGAFVNQDQSINVKLDALPVNGELQIRERDPNDWPRRTASNDPMSAIGGEP